MRVERVDVIVCTNSDGAFLGTALDSVAAQSWPHWSVTVIDDGSEHPEGLADAVAGREDVRLIRIDHAGLPAARNAGIRATDAPFITFLDDDDIWDPRRLELLVGALESDPAAVAAYSGGWNIDPSGRSIGVEWNAGPATSEDMIRGAVPFPRLFTLLASRAAMATAGPFDESYSIAEDNEFMLRFLATGELVAVPERLVGYRRHDRNMTVTTSWTRDDPSIRLLTEGVARARAQGDERLRGLIRENLRRYRRVRSRIRADDALHEARTGRIRAALGTMAGALTMSPRGVADSLVGKARKAARRLGRRR